MKTNKVLMQEARESLKGKWGFAIGAYVLSALILVIAGVAPRGAGSLFRFILTGPISLGVALFSLMLARGESPELGKIFEGFNEFVRALAAYAWMALFLFLWALIAIIPAIIVALVFYLSFLTVFIHSSPAVIALTISFLLLAFILLCLPVIIATLRYSQLFFILAEDKTIPVQDALKKSIALMEGNKMKLFLLGWRFFGWILLSVLTLGIGFLWLAPYLHVTAAKFYDDIKK